MRGLLRRSVSKPARPTLLRVLMMYFIVGTLLLSMFSVFIFKQVSMKSEREFSDVSAQMLRQYQDVSEKILLSIYNYFLHEFDADRTMFNALYSNRFEPLEQSNIRKRLSDEVNANPWLHSIYVYNKVSDIVFSNFTPAKTIDTFYDQSIIQQMEEQSTNYAGMRFPPPLLIPRHMQYTLNLSKIAVDAISAVYLAYDNKYTLEAALVVNINIREIMQSFLPTNVTGERVFDEVFFLSGDNLAMAHSNSQYIGKDMSEVGYVKRILSDIRQEGSFAASVDGVNRLVTFIKSSSSSLGWTFVSLSDFSQLAHSIDTLQRFASVLTIAFILLGMLLWGIITGRVYLPLFREYSPARRQEILRRLVNGEPVTDYSLLNMRPDSAYYQAVIIQINNWADLCKDQERSASLRASCAAKVQTSLGALCRVDTLEQQDGIIYALLSYSNNDINYNDSLLKIRQQIHTDHNVNTTVAIGNPVDSVSELYQSCEGARFAVKYSLLLGSEHILAENDIRLREFAPYIYPTSKEKLLFDALRLNDRAGVGNALLDFFQDISSFSYEDTAMALHQLALASFRVRDTLAVQRIPSYSVNISQVIAEMNSLDEAQAWFAAMYAELIAARDTSKDQRQTHNALITSLRDQVASGFNDPDLSIESLSELAGYSTNYVRALFRDAVGESLSNYILRVRLDEGSRLLQTTALSVNQIAEHVGFRSGSYFSVCFKKRNGVSPEQFRKMR